MTDGDLDYLGQGYWRKRIHQLKHEFRSTASDHRLTLPEQAKPYGAERKPKRDLPSGKPARANRPVKTGNSTEVSGQP